AVDGLEAMLAALRIAGVANRQLTVDGVCLDRGDGAGGFHSAVDRVQLHGAGYAVHRDGPVYGMGFQVRGGGQRNAVADRAAAVPAFGQLGFDVNTVAAAGYDDLHVVEI